METDSVEKRSDPYALLFRSLATTTEMIAGTLGAECEVVLHDLRHPCTSVVKVVNGHVTKRSVGQGIRDLMGILQSPRFQNDQLLNYTFTTEAGRLIKSSTALYRNEEGEVLAAICINWDITRLTAAQSALGELIQTAPSGEKPTTERPPDLDRTLDELIRNTIAEQGRPAAALTREERLRIVQFLDVRGAFRIRGGVDRVAEALGVSRYSIYKYLEEVRGQ